MTNSIPPLDASAQRRKRLAEMLRRSARGGKTVIAPSMAQRGVWYMQQRNLDSSAYHVAFCVRVVSKIDVSAAQEALQLLVDRHAMLRSTFHHNGEDLEIVVHGAAAPGFTVIDASGMDETLLRASTQKALVAPFDLTIGPLVHMTLLSRDTEDHVLLLVIHHLICDGWSLGIVLQEFMDLYEGEILNRPSRLSQKSVDFDQFIFREASWLSGDASDASRNYWLNKLGGRLPELHLPAVRAHQAPESIGQKVINVTIDQRLYADLKHASLSCGITTFCLFLAAYQLFMMRISGQDDVVIGVPMAGRTEEAYDAVVGHFVNLVALRGQLHGNPSFRDFAARVWTDLKHAIEHQQFPFVELVRLLRPTGSIEAPIFRTHLNILKPDMSNPLGAMLAAEVEPRDWGPLKVSPYDVEVLEEAYDVAFRIVEADDTLRLKIQYDGTSFSDRSMKHLSDCFQELLQSIASQPDCSVRQLNLLPAAERKQMLEAWNATDRPLESSATVATMIAEQAERVPHAIALVFGDESLDYATLDRRANNLASELISIGVGADDVVAVFAARSVELVVALLATLKCGAAYVPIDPHYPRERLEFVLRDCGARLVLVTAAVEHALPPMDIPRLVLGRSMASTPFIRPALDIDPASLAYIIYTSGSTGQPKGVEISHRALVNFIVAMQDELPIGPSDVLLSVTTPAFDIFGLELFLPLTAGAHIELASNEEIRDGKLLAALIADRGVTFLQATPVTWRILLAAGFQAPEHFTGLCGGEALDPSLAGQLLAAGVALWNMYGPTETTIWSCIGQVTDGYASPVSIGRPIGNTQAYVLDDQLQPVPIGVVGKLYLGGEGLARGYRNQPQLTEEKFVTWPSPERAKRLYNSGDLACFLFDGRLECRGRADLQVKLRGYRIELEEIEMVLANHSEVGQAVVRVEGGHSQDARLVAFIQHRPGAVMPDARELRTWLGRSLPEYMIPSQFIFVDSFPLTPNGKIDRAALSGGDAPGLSIDVYAPQELLPNEQFLLEVWQELLGIDNISIDQDFFEIGGHSLLAAQMIARLEKFHNRTLSIALLVRSRTIRDLAMAIQEMPSLEPGPCLFTFRVGNGAPPLVMMPSMAGTALHWAKFVEDFNSERPFAGIYMAGEPDYDQPFTLEEFAADCAKIITSAFPDRPCHLLGYSFGGSLSVEVARQLRALGQSVGVVAIVDKPPTRFGKVEVPTWPVIKNFLSRAAGALMSGGSLKLKLITLMWLVRLAGKRVGGRDVMMQEYILGRGDIPERSRRLVSWFTKLDARYDQQLYEGDVLVIRAAKRPARGPFDHDLGWSKYVRGTVDVEVLEGGHNDMLKPDHARKIMAKLSERFQAFEMEVQPATVKTSADGASVPVPKSLIRN